MFKMIRAGIALWARRIEQHLLQAVVEHVARRARHLGPHHHQVALTIALPTHRHSQTPVQSPRTIDSDQPDFVNGLVKVHVKAILRKIGVQNRTQAAIWALSQAIPNALPGPAAHASRTAANVLTGDEVDGLSGSLPRSSTH